LGLSARKGDAMEGRRHLGPARWLGILVALLSLGLVGSAGAAPGARVTTTTIYKTWLGPAPVAAGETTIIHAVNFRHRGARGERQDLDASGAVKKSMTFSIPANGDRIVSYGWDLDNDGAFAQIRSTSTLVRGAMEVTDTATGELSMVLYSAEVFTNPGMALAGPLTLSDQLTEEVLAVNVASASRTITFTTYDEAGTMVDQVSMPAAPMTVVKYEWDFDYAVAGLHSVINVNGTGPSVMGTVAAVAADGRAKAGG
jgi:hypothetical protein